MFHLGLQRVQSPERDRTDVLDSGRLWQRARRVQGRQRGALAPPAGRPPEVHQGADQVPGGQAGLPCHARRLRQHGGKIACL
jgi:hypothetical protein